MYKNEKAINLYGSTCGAWDQAPGTPWYSYCPNTSNWSHPDYNWCQQPWCYVDPSCPDAVPSSVFTGSADASHYSYLSCGSKSDCYTNIAWNKTYKWPANCPYDPTGSKTYKTHKAGSCACMFQGKALPSTLYDNYPSKSPAGCNNSTDCKKYPGMYKALAAIKYYGTTCVSWDQQPGTPWYSYCPAGSKWCGYDHNWCQQPWCYVDSSCATAVPSTVFSGSDTGFYSYNTCANAPDCYSKIAWNSTPSPPKACPFDSSDNGWHTDTQCPNGWRVGGTTTTTTVMKAGKCTCKFHGSLLSAAIYDNYPTKSPASCTVGTDCKKYPGM